MTAGNARGWTEKEWIFVFFPMWRDSLEISCSQVVLRHPTSTLTFDILSFLHEFVFGGSLKICGSDLFLVWIDSLGEFPLTALLCKQSVDEFLISLLLGCFVSSRLMSFSFHCCLERHHWVLSNLWLWAYLIWISGWWISFLSFWGTTENHIFGICTGQTGRTLHTDQSDEPDQKECNDRWERQRVNRERIIIFKNG